MLSPVEPGWVRSQLPPDPPQHRRVVRRGARRPRPGRAAGHHPLAVAQLLRLLPRQLVGAVDPRRPRRRRSRRAGDVVGDEPGLHRGREPRARLARRAARAARTAFRRPGRGAASSSTAGPTRTCAPSSPPATARGGAAHRRTCGRTRRPKRTRRSRRASASPGCGRTSSALVDVDDAFADAARRARRRDGRRPRRRARAVPRRRHRRHDVVDGHRPGRRRSSTCAGTAYGSTSTRRWPGSAGVVPELRPVVNAGLDGVDSWCFDPHKWLFTNFDCSCCTCATAPRCIQSLSVLPEYLRNAASRVRRGNRLPRLARAPRAALPCAQALVRHPPLRRRGPRSPRAPPRRAGARVRRLGRRQRPLRAGRAGAAQPRLLQPRGRRRRRPSACSTQSTRAAART